jgi:hypothetical protein
MHLKTSVEYSIRLEELCQLIQHNDKNRIVLKGGRIMTKQNLGLVSLIFQQRKNEGSNIKSTIYKKMYSGEYRSTLLNTRGAS